MKTLYLDCGMGAAGDMLTGALMEVLASQGADGGPNGAVMTCFTDRFNNLGIPGVVMQTEPSVRKGVAGTHVRMLINGEEEGASDGHAHHHTDGHDHNDDAHHHEPHHHDHKHRSMADVKAIIDSLDIDEEVRADILAVYALIADAESRVHGEPVTEIHFHEVGALDAIADVTAVCMLMREIAPDRVIASPVATGYGKVRCAHGLLPVPAPATAILLEGVPSYAGDIEGELCTPTGAALIRHFAGGFQEAPDMIVTAAGSGMGTKDFERANCVRAILGETE